MCVCRGGWWLCDRLLELVCPYLPLLLQLAEHEHRGDAMLPHHAPELIDGRAEGTLSQDVLVSVLVALCVCVCVCVWGGGGVL